MISSDRPPVGAHDLEPAFDLGDVLVHCVDHVLHLGDVLLVSGDILDGPDIFGDLSLDLAEGLEHFRLLLVVLGLESCDFPVKLVELIATGRAAAGQRSSVLIQLSKHNFELIDILIGFLWR